MYKKQNWKRWKEEEKGDEGEEGKDNLSFRTAADDQKLDTTMVDENNGTMKN